MEFLKGLSNNEAALASNELSRFRQSEQNIMTNLRCATMCMVTAVYKDGNVDPYRYPKSIDANPIVGEAVNSKNGIKYLALPELKNIPYYTAPYNDNHPAPQVGEFCVCIHLDRSIAGVDINNPDFIPSDGNKHSLSDAVAFVGFFR